MQIINLARKYPPCNYKTLQRALLFAWLTALVIACNEAPDRNPGSTTTRPVTVLELTERDFRHVANLTGLVSLYREEQIGFEVQGRVLSVLDVGREVEGPVVDESGKLVHQGDAIASIDDTRYRLKVEVIRARLISAQHELEAIEAELDRASKTLKRQKRIFTKGAGDQQTVDDAASAYHRLIAKRGQQIARISETTEQLNQAMEDLEDCILQAPFSGRVTSIHVTQGAVIEAGTAIVTLTLMDPIQVQVAVSADEERKLHTGNPAFLLPKDPVHPNGDRREVPALIFEKGSVADTETHTFRIDLIARNQRLLIEDFIPDTAGLPLVRDFLPAVRRYQGEPGPLFIPANSIYRDGDQSYVLRLPGIAFRSHERRNAFGRHVPEKIAVQLGDDYMSIVTWTFRSLIDSGTLQEGDFLVIDPKPEHEAGLAIGHTQWLLRPGDLVPVRFLLDSTPRGLYVPVDSITLIDGKHRIFIAENGIARSQAVSLHESFGELRRIEGPGLEPGTEIIVGGIHYVSDGQAIRIVGRESDLQ